VACARPWAAFWDRPFHGARQGGFAYLESVAVLPVSISVELSVLLVPPSSEPQPGPSSEVEPAGAATPTTLPDVPKEVRLRFPGLVRALGAALRIEDYDAPVVQRHVEDLSQIPPRLLRRLCRAGVREVHLANRGAAELDRNQHLKGRHPRGYPPGATWDDVAGAYNPVARSIVAGRGVHASASVALHEVGHALGDRFRFDSHSQLISAHRRLYRRLSPYEQRGGLGALAGRRELLAEAIAVLLIRGEVVAVQLYDRHYVDFLKGVVLR
jgi:hypothetical protein